MIGISLEILKEPIVQRKDLLTREEDQGFSRAGEAKLVFGH